MTGRDLRLFITHHRGEDTEKLTLRIKSGIGGEKCQPVHYEKLQTLIESKKLASAHIEKKIERTLRAAWSSRESTLLRQHRQVWIREHARLMAARMKAESELQNFLRQDGEDSELLSQLLDYDLFLESERRAFRTATVDPIWQLRDDLRSRLTEARASSSQRSFQTHEWDLILQQVQFVKEQQEAIVEKLHTECLRLKEDISALAVEGCVSLTQDTPQGFEQVPAEILHSECPYPDLKTTLLHEFQALSEKYASRLESIEMGLQGMDRHCGWPAEDHLVFQVTVTQYPPDLSKHRALIMDMLHKLLPHRSKQELHDHERVWDHYRYTLAQRQALVQSWRRDWADLLAKALMTLGEARLVHQQGLATRSGREKQQETCSQLREKLRQWREQQDEVARLEEAAMARQREEEEERLTREQEKEGARRRADKERVREFYAEKQKRRAQLEERAQQRMAELKALMMEQARRDKERVQFREDILLRRREEREVQALLRQQEQEEKRERLESLRSQAAVFVKADPDRMMGDTQASKNRCHTEGEEFVLQKPLYQLHTYTDTQIVSDPRVRIEQALREAGLHNTLYAKEVLSTISPPKPQRRDTKCTGFRF